MNSKINSVGPAEKYFGSKSPTRTSLFVLVSILAWFFEASLLIFLRAPLGSRGMPATFYILPVAHLLPWFAGLQSMRSVSRAAKNGSIDGTAAALCSSCLIGLLAATYVTLSSFEIALGVAWGLRN
jgi:hypothetical protein